MNLTEWVLVGLCLNASCPENGNPSEEQRSRFKHLEDEMRGKTFRIVTLQNYPISYTSGDGDRLVGHGVAFEVINALQKLYKFDYTVADGDAFGNRSHGVLGMLAEGKADLAATFLPIMPDLGRKIRYSVGLDAGEWVVMMRRPSESATGSGLLAPFTLGVWMLTLVSLTVVGPLIYLLILLKRRLCKGGAKNEAYPLPACVWFVYGALLKQGSTLSPVTDSTRLLFATWWLFITVLTAFYTANLTAFLTLSQFTLPISKPRDIGEKHYSWVTREGNFIQTSLVDNRGALSDDLRGSHSVFLDAGQDEDVLETWVMRKNYMYIDDKPTLEHRMYADYLEKARRDVDEQHRCTFVITDWHLAKRARAFAFAHSFKYIPVFDKALQHIIESGITEYLKRIGLPNTRICPLNLESNERRLKNQDLLLTYFIVSGGYGLSLLAFLGELATRRSSRWRRRLKEAITGKFTEKGSRQENVYYQWKSFVVRANYKEEVQVKAQMTRKFVNGTEYLVGHGGSLVPLRSASALLFHYANVKPFYFDK